MKEKKANDNVKKNRKQLRKEKRQAKKVRKNDYYTNRNKGGKFVRPLAHDDEIDATQINKKEELQKKEVDIIEKEKREQRKLEDQMKKQRKKQMMDANVEEDRTIKKLEKQLNLNKRKNKSVPKSFAADGLDYLLEVCDSENMANIISAEKHLTEVDTEFEEDFALMTNRAINIDSEDDNSDDDFENILNEDDGSSDLDEDLPDEDIEIPTKRMKPNANNTKNVSKKMKAKKIKVKEVEEVRIEEEASEDESDNDSKNSDRPIEQSSKCKSAEVVINNKEIDSSDMVSDNEDVNEESDEDIGNTSNDTKKVNKDGTWEDIYGRLRDKDGNIITVNKSEGKYIPPAVRAKMEGALGEDKKRQEKLNRLKRQIKGLLNRLAESNMHNIANQIEELYMSNSRNDMNETMTSLILESLVSNVTAPERLLLEHILLITILQANVGTEVGAHFLQTVIKRFDELYNEDHPVENKSLDNIVSIIAQLYNFKVFHSQLLYQILTKLSNKFEEKHVECILLILKSVGFTLRKDDPVTLKNLILDLQKRASNVSEDLKENPRVKFMLEILLAIKNNNMTKIPNYDTSYSEHLKKIMKGFIRKGNYVTQLNIALDDLLRAEERGKWWVVGSAWTGKADDDVVQNQSKGKSDGYSQKLLHLARKQRMNTDTRRNIFCIIMSAEDYLDAFEKLLHLSLKNQQEREIIHVLLHCCLQEKKYNPYYSVLAQKMCDHDRKFQMTIKYSVWDKLKSLTECSGVQISNLAKLLTYLFLEKGLSISTLKIVQFSDLDKVTLRFMRQILLGILLSEDLEQCQGVFEKVAQSDKLKMFRESLRLFIHHFLLRNVNSIPEEQKELLEERAKFVERILTASDKRSRIV